MATALAQTASTTTKAKNAAALASIGKKLFSNEALNLNPTAVTALLKGAGIPVPKNVVITADIAQLIISGGAFISDINKAASIQSFMQPTAQILQATIDLMGQMGWIDPKSPGAQLLTLGADTAMVIATGGVNVIADLKLAMDIVQMGFTAPDAQSIANADIAKFINVRRTMQTDALSESFQAYHQGSIGVFGLMGRIAEESPDYFTNYFPNTQQFFPPYYVTYTENVTSTSALGTSTNSGTASATIQTILNNSHQIVEQTIWKNMVEPSLLGFKKLNDSQISQGKISVQNLALLSLLPPYINEYPYSGFDVSLLLQKLHLTPDDLNDALLENSFMTPITQPYTINGLDTHPVPLQPPSLNAAQQNLLKANQMGRIDILMKDVPTKTALSNWGTPQWIGALIPNTLPSTGQKFFSKTISNEMMTQPERQMRNYWSALSLLNEFNKDQWFFSDVQPEVQMYGFMGNVNDINTRHQQLLFKVQTRSLNQLAYKNISTALGVAPGKLKLVKAGTPGSPAVFQ